MCGDRQWEMLADNNICRFEVRSDGKNNLNEFGGVGRTPRGVCLTSSLRLGVSLAFSTRVGHSGVAYSHLLATCWLCL